MSAEDFILDYLKRNPGCVWSEIWRKYNSQSTDDIWLPICKLLKERKVVRIGFKVNGLSKYIYFPGETLFEFNGVEHQ